MFGSAGECYQRVKQALHTAMPDRLVCREKEMGEVNEFLDTHLTKSKAGSLYISGAPGTGKTAVISLTRQRLQVGFCFFIDVPLKVMSTCTTGQF